MLIIRGINDNRFNSRPIQAPNQEDDEIESKEPISKVKKKKREEIGKII